MGKLHITKQVACYSGCVSFVVVVVVIALLNCFRPQSLLNGMNRFLESLEITFRRDPNNLRPRINKMSSVKVCSTLTVVKK